MTTPRKFETVLGFIRAKPPLSGIRIDGDDHRIVRIIARGYSAAEHAVLDLAPSLIEGLDAHGNVVRTMKLGDEKPATAPAARVEAPLIWPEGETAQIGKVIANTVDSICARYEALFRMSFDELKTLHKAASERVGSLESMYYDDMKARIAEADARAEAAEAQLDEVHEKLAETMQGKPGAADTLLGTVLGGMANRMLGVGEQQPPPATNGVAKS